MSHRRLNTNQKQTASPFDPTYIGGFRILPIKGNQAKIMAPHGGKTKVVHISDVKYILLIENIICKIPDYHQFGKKTQL